MRGRVLAAIIVVLVGLSALYLGGLMGVTLTTPQTTRSSWEASYTTTPYETVTSTQPIYTTHTTYTTYTTTQPTVTPTTTPPTATTASSTEASLTHTPTTTFTTNFTPPWFGPAPLYDIIKPITYEEYLELLSNKGKTVYLPTYLPDDLRPVAVWVEGDYALIAYAEEPVENYGYAPMGIELMPTAMSYSEMRAWCEYLAYNRPNVTLVTGDDMVFAILAWRGGGTPEYISRYGPYMHIAVGWKSGLYYIIGVAPSYATPEDLEKIIRSLAPVP